ncbi:hypothetical protein Tco_0418850 [Tanacetum coccineum]
MFFRGSIRYEILSDSDDSTVTYTAVSRPFRGLLDIGSLGVDGPPVMPEDPYAYIVAAFQAPPSPDYVSGPEYPPSPEFVPELVYPEVDDDEEEGEPSRDDVNDEKEDEDDEEEEEEHPALADSVPPPVHHIPSPPLPVSPPPPASPTYPLGYHAAIIQLRAEAPSTSYSLPLPPPIILSRTRSDAPPSGTPRILPIPLPTSSPSLLLPSTDHGADRPEDEMLEDMSGAPMTDETELGQRMTNIVTIVRHDTYRRAHAHTALLMEKEAKLYRKAWGRSMDACDLACSEVMALRTQVVAQQSKIGRHSLWRH